MFIDLYQKTATEIESPDGCRCDWCGEPIAPRQKCIEAKNPDALLAQFERTIYMHTECFAAYIRWDYRDSRNDSDNNPRGLTWREWDQTPDRKGNLINHIPPDVHGGPIVLVAPASCFMCGKVIKTGEDCYWSNSHGTLTFSHLYDCDPTESWRQRSPQTQEQNRQIGLVTKKSKKHKKR